MADFGVLDAGAVSPVATLVPVWSVLDGATEVTDGDVTAEFDVVVVCGNVDVVVVSSNCCSGASANGASPLKMSRIASMFFESLCQINTSAPPTIFPVASTW